MTVKELMEQMDLKLLTPQADLSAQVSVGYTCDLLSWVMSHGAQGMAWITVQTHMNVVAVASLLEMSCVIIPESIQVPDDVAAKADEEGVALLSSECTAYELCGRMRELGVAHSKRQ